MYFFPKKKENKTFHFLAYEFVRFLPPRLLPVKEGFPPSARRGGHLAPYLSPSATVAIP